MPHIIQMVEEITESVAQIKVVKNRCMMGIMTDTSLTLEQKDKIVQLLQPLDVSIATARKSFLFGEME